MTAFDRLAVRNNVASDRLSDLESHILRQFQRRAHHFIDSPPAPSQHLEWLAIIQHHGGATRLLDFTSSFYVATFFAVENARADAAVWAISTLAMDWAISDRLDTPEHQRSGFPQDGYRDQINAWYNRQCNETIGGDIYTKLVLRVEPERMNERLAAQQGLFLFPLAISESFMVNLAHTFDCDEAAFTDPVPQDYTGVEPIVKFGELPCVLKIVIPRNLHDVALRDLQQMNISAASLFPGLDGFARSLRYQFIEYSRDRTAADQDP